MKAITTLRNQKFSNQLSRTFKSFSNTMLKVYRKHGETKDCINKIQQELLKLTHTQLDTEVLLNNISPLDRHVQEDNCHYVIRVVHTESLKIALHITPSGTKLPAHSHPDSLNALLVKTGEVEVQQSSILSFSHLSKQIITLAADECSVGLQCYNNNHSLLTTSPLNVFYSIRCKVTKSFVNSFARPLAQPLVGSSALSFAKLGLVKLQLRLKLALGFSLLMSPIYSCGFSDFMDHDVSLQIASIYKPERAVLASSLKQDTSTGSDIHETVKQANSIRAVTNDDEQHLQAFELYLNAALKNSAEAQYWLSIMYLKGMGVTDDDDKALHWVSASANQNYKPAKELLHHLLTYDEALDC